MVAKPFDSTGWCTRRIRYTCPHIYPYIILFKHLKNLNSQICSYEKKSFWTAFPKLKMIEKYKAMVEIWLEIYQEIQISSSEIKNQYVYGQQLSKTETKLPWPGFTCGKLKIYDAERPLDYVWEVFIWSKISREIW